jgi:hypothetical protein
MRFRAGLSGALAGALATGAVAQPYIGIFDPTFWQSIGRFNASSDGRTGSSSDWARLAERSSDGETATADVVEVYDQEQFIEGRGSYWQEFMAITFRCRENKYLVIGSAFYNKPRRPGTSADKLWEVQNPSNEYGDVQPNTVGAAAMKVACS